MLLSRCHSLCLCEWSCRLQHSYLTFCSMVCLSELLYLSHSFPMALTHSLTPIIPLSLFLFLSLPTSLSPISLSIPSLSHSPCHHPLPRSYLPLPLPPHVSSLSPSLPPLSPSLLSPSPHTLSPSVSLSSLSLSSFILFSSLSLCPQNTSTSPLVIK